MQDLTAIGSSLLYMPGDEFTLERIIDIGLDQYCDVIGDISSAASKELAIEQVGESYDWQVAILVTYIHVHTCMHTLAWQIYFKCNSRCCLTVTVVQAHLWVLCLPLQAIQDIANQWKDLTLDISPYKERGHFRLR